MVVGKSPQRIPIVNSSPSLNQQAHTRMKLPTLTTGHRDGIARFFATHLQEVKELLITVVNDSQ